MYDICFKFGKGDGEYSLGRGDGGTTNDTSDNLSAKASVSDQVELCPCAERERLRVSTKGD